MWLSSAALALLVVAGNMCAEVWTALAVRFAEQKKNIRIRDAEVARPGAVSGVE